MEVKDFLFKLSPRKPIEYIGDNETPGKALDLGCGEGQNAVYLASKGWDVTAVDINNERLEKANHLASENKVDVKFVNQDLREYEIRGEFSLVYSLQTLQFIEPEAQRMIIESIKEHTSHGGLNVIMVAVEGGEAPHPYKMNTDSLKNYYKDWKIEKFKEHEGPLARKREDGSDIMQNFAMIRARKSE